MCGYLGREEEEERLVAVKTMAEGAGQGERDDFVRGVNISILLYCNVHFSWVTNSSLCGCGAS